MTPEGRAPGVGPAGSRTSVGQGRPRGDRPGTGWDQASRARTSSRALFHRGTGREERVRREVFFPLAALFRRRPRFRGHEFAPVEKSKRGVSLLLSQFVRLKEKAGGPSRIQGTSGRRRRVECRHEVGGISRLALAPDGWRGGTTRAHSRGCGRTSQASLLGIGTSSRVDQRGGLHCEKGSRMGAVRRGAV